MSESDKSGKPELTSEDESSIKEFIGALQGRLAHDPFHAAQWGILHERSAAQARIAELEARVEELEEALVIAWRDQMNVTKF